MSIVGQSVTRVDARSKVLGQALYPGDINLPNQAYMKILFANRPHAIVRAIDTTQAEALPGVLAVFTAKDVPVNEYGLGVADQPVLCGPGSSIPYADRVRFVGDQVALVVAESEEIAAQARDLILVDYEDLPVVTDMLEAMKPGAPRLHPGREGVDRPDSNVFTHFRIRKGDVEAAFAQADVIVEGEYRTPAQEHAYLQPEAGVAYMDEDGRVTVQVAGQWAHEDREQIAHSLGLPEEQVRVIYPAIGGAFGGREDMSVQIVLALAAWRLSQRGIHRPVKIIWSREESIIGHHKRHPYILRTRWGARRDGKLLAADVEVIADGGAYVYTSPKVLGNATLMCTGPYEIPNVKVDSYAVYTNNLPNGAFRGFGGPQGAFEAEMQMSRLAEALGMDPVELRRRNLLDEGSLLSVGTPLPKGVSIRQVVDQCALKQEERLQALAAAPARPPRLRGHGFACAFKNVGFSFGAPEQCTATVALHGRAEIERAVLYHAGAEVGQGTHTVMAQMAAETLGLPLDKVELVVSDTATTQNSGSVSASRMTFMAGNSIKGACEQALAKWRAEERPAVATYQYRPPRTTPYDPQTGKAEPNFAYGYVAQAVTVEVDTETGHVYIVEVVSADDVGKAVNPQNVQGQIEGAVVQAAGYAVLENFVQQDGYVKTSTLSTYLIPTVLDVPDAVHSLILEYADPIGPYGARGMGEMPFLPLVPAVMAALHDATGVWFYEFPLTPERVLRGLGKLGKA
ncbi:MAG TPA: xanthine dehydrogenase family protein molybdopterin-binding subunit [Anaerolineales bacterium]|nr:xanthine dehydrogenase family protein molybdopterin-binding subunit [Anaerolineales bacterium]